MLHNLLIYSLILFVGVIAGFINTLAGNGSIITLPLLIFLGLPAQIANATNRVAVIVQSLVGLFTIKGSGNISKQELIFLITPCFMGSIIGALVAVSINQQYINIYLLILMVVVLFTLLFNSSEWLKQHSPDGRAVTSIKSLLMFFAIGFHGGFIQVGVGIFLLAGLVVGAGYSLAMANRLKILIVFLLTLPAFLLFWYYHQINWFWGILLAIGQAIGAYIASKFVNNANATKYIRWLIIVIILFSIAKIIWY